MLKRCIPFIGLYLVVLISTFSKSGEQLLIFIGKDSISTHFKETTLKDVQSYADSNKIELTLVPIENGAPKEVVVTPSFFYQNHRGRSLYSGRYLTIDRLINFIRTAKYSPRKESVNQKEHLPIWNTGRATIGTPIKVTHLEGIIPKGFNQEKFIQESKVQIRKSTTDFKAEKNFNLLSSGRLFYTDYHPYLSEDSTLHINTAIFSMFHCHKAVYQSDEPITGKWKDRAKLFEQVAKSQERLVKEQLTNLKWGDAFTPVPTTIPLVEWNTLGLKLPEKTQLVQTDFQLDRLPKKWKFSNGLLDGSPIIQFSFGSPVDHYSGEAKTMKMQLELPSDSTLIGAKGYVVVKNQSITMGDDGLDEYLFEDVLKTGLLPNSTYDFVVTKAPNQWDFFSEQKIELEGDFHLLGKSVPLKAFGSIDIVLDKNAQPRLQVNGNFTLPLKALYGIDGPDGPSPAKDELEFQLNFLLEPTETLHTLSNNLYKVEKTNSATAIKKEHDLQVNNEEYINWKASTKLYKARGSFESWYFKELKIPNNNFEKVSAQLVIEISSLSERSKLLVKHLKGDHFFDLPNFPVANVKINGATQLEGNRYKGNATATIKGISSPIELIFEVVDSKSLEVIGSAKIEREKFGIGTTYKKAKNISKLVELEFKTFLKDELK